MGWVAKSVYTTPSPQRRPLIIASSLFFIILVSFYLTFPLSPPAAPSDIFTSSPSASSKPTVPHRVPSGKTVVTVDYATDSEVQKHSFVTRYHDPETPPSTLILVATRDDSSWGRNYDEGDRTFEDFLEMISRQRLDAMDLTLGLLTSNMAALESYSTILMTKDLPIASAEIIYAPNMNFEVGPDNSKRTFKMRNFLMAETLKEQEHILWIDPDIFMLPDGLFERIREVSSRPITEFEVANVAQGEKANMLPSGLITVLCRHTSYTDLARNAWTGPSKAALKKWQDGK
ncbi:hypothetical protein ABW20_dc0108975 [Dactylellina cionopaga]|nr:hypothetical protein ABW20_dc0108975 [Dactylellina cionopaga]